MLVISSKTDTELRVYDADGLAPNLSIIKPSRFLFFWVIAASVWSKSEQVKQPVQILELLAMWDCEGKLENEFKSFGQLMYVLSNRLLSPLGKILCIFLYNILKKQKVAQFGSTPQIVVTNTSRKSLDILFPSLRRWLRFGLRLLVPTMLRLIF